MNPEDRLRDMIDKARDPSTTSDAEWERFAGRAHRALFVRRAATVVGSAGLVVALAVGAWAVTRQEDFVPEPLPPAASPSIEPSPAESPEPDVSPSPTDDGEGSYEGAFEAEIWLVGSDGMELFYRSRIVPSTSESLAGVPPHIIESQDGRRINVALAISELLQGPSTQDVEVKAFTSIPEGTRLLDVELRGTTAILDFSREFNSGSGTTGESLQIAQVVYTATQFGSGMDDDRIDGVLFKIEGRRVDYLGGHGIMVDKPQTRNDWMQYGPAIVVHDPTPGEELSSPITVTGDANVYEANVNIRILDADGDVLKEAFTTATCGTGCWGEFVAELRLKITERQQGTVEVLTYSAEDGSRQDVVSIPVTLVP